MSILTNLAKPQFIMNVFLHVIILFMILSTLLKVIIAPLINDAFASSINNLMYESITANTTQIIQNPLINDQLYKLLTMQLNDYMKNLLIIKQGLTVTNESIKTVNTINTNLTKIQSFLISSNLMVPSTTRSITTSSTLNTYQTKVNEIIVLLETIQTVLNNNHLKLNLISIINIIDNTPVFKQVSAHLSKPHEVAQAKNSGLFDKLLVFNLFFIIFFIILVFIFRRNNEIDIKHILIENGLTFLFIGIVEILFFLKIAFKFMPVKPSFLTTQLFEMLKLKLST